MKRSSSLAKSFRAELRELHPSDINKSFLYWYVAAAFGSGVDGSLPRNVSVEYTDRPGEGAIDAVIQDDNSREAYLIQAKYHDKALAGETPSRQQQSDFNKTREALAAFSESRANFQAYLANSVANKELRSIYLRLYAQARRRALELKWHFISLHRPPKDTRVPRGSNLACYWHDDVMSLYAETLIDWRPPHRPLKLKAVATPLSHELQFGGSRATASVATVHISDFLRYMERDPANRLFSGNVRDFLGEESLNVDIRNTFQEHPHEFWWSNNGITVICESAPYDKGTLTVIRPCVINGCQTLRSCQTAPGRPTNAEVLVRLIQVGPYTEDKIDDIQRTIERTNHQNRITYVDLRANDPMQVRLQRDLLRHGVFYERRRGSARQLGTHISVHGSMKLKPVQLAQSIVACGSHPAGPADAKQQAEGLFADEYSHIFNTSLDIARVLFLVTVGRCVEEFLWGRSAAPKRHPKFVTFRLVASALDRALGRASAQRRHNVELLLKKRELRNRLQPLVKLVYNDCSASWRKVRATMEPNTYFKNRDSVAALVKRLDGKYDSTATRLCDSLFHSTH